MGKGEGRRLATLGPAGGSFPHAPACQTVSVLIVISPRH